MHISQLKISESAKTSNKMNGSYTSLPSTCHWPFTSQAKSQHKSVCPNFSNPDSDCALLISFESVWWIIKKFENQRKKVRTKGELPQADSQSAACLHCFSPCLLTSDSKFLHFYRVWLDFFLSLFITFSCKSSTRKSREINTGFRWENQAPYLNPTEKIGMKSARSYDHLIFRKSERYI